MSSSTEKSSPPRGRFRLFGAKRRDRIGGDNKGVGGVHKSRSMVNLASTNSAAAATTTATASSSLKSCLSTNNLSGMSSTNKKEMKRSVSFHKIQIREYERALSDHPAVRKGPAVGLSWKHVGTQSVDLERYETERQPRQRRDFVLSPSKREEILKHECGVTHSEMTKAMREANSIKRGRRATVASPRSVHRRQEAVESASRKVKRLFTNNKKQDEMTRLWRNAEKYQTIQQEPAPPNTETYPSKQKEAPVNKQQESTSKNQTKETKMKRAASCNDIGKRAEERNNGTTSLALSRATTAQSCGNLLHMMSLNDESDSDQDAILFQSMHMSHKQQQQQQQQQPTANEPEKDSFHEDEWGFGFDEATGEHWT